MTRLKTLERNLLKLVDIEIKKLHRDHDIYEKDKPKKDSLNLVYVDAMKLLKFDIKHSFDIIFVRTSEQKRIFNELIEDGDPKIEINEGEERK